MSLYWRMFNFLTRRIVAPSFAVGGIIVGLSNIGSVLPGGMVNINGVPSDDLIMRWTGVVMPLSLAYASRLLQSASRFSVHRGRLMVGCLSYIVRGRSSNEARR